MCKWPSHLGPALRVPQQSSWTARSSNVLSRQADGASPPLFLSECDLECTNVEHAFFYHELGMRPVRGGGAAGCIRDPLQHWLTLHEVQRRRTPTKH